MLPFISYFLSSCLSLSLRHYPKVRIKMLREGGVGDLLASSPGLSNKGVWCHLQPDTGTLSAPDVAGHRGTGLPRECPWAQAAGTLRPPEVIS